MSEKDLNKIKASFEENGNKAPENSWSNLSIDLDNKKLDNKVKESFEASNFVAPLFDFNSLGENSADALVKESFEQTFVAAPDSVWEGIFSGLEVDKSWEEIADKIVVKSTAWRTVLAAACLVMLVSLIPNYVTDTSFKSAAVIVGEFGDELVSQDLKVASESSDVEETRFGVVQTNESINEPISPLQIIAVAGLSETETAQERLELVDAKDAPPISKITQFVTVGAIPTHHIEKLEEEKQSKWSFGIYGGLNRTWIHDDLSRDAYDKNTTTASKFVVGDMKGVSLGYDFNNGMSVQTNLFSATSRNKLGMFDQGNYIFRTNQIKFLKANILLSKSLLPIENKMNVLLKAGPSFAYVLSNSTKVENKIITFNEGYKKLNIAANLQAGLSYKFSSFIFETGANVELGLRNLLVGSGADAGSNFTNNMDLGIYTSLRYQF